MVHRMVQLNSRLNLSCQLTVVNCQTWCIYWLITASCQAFIFFDFKDYYLFIRIMAYVLTTDNRQVTTIFAFPHVDITITKTRGIRFF